MVIRSFQPKDADELGAIFYRSVHEIGGRHYSQAQVNAWAPDAPTAKSYIERDGDDRTFLVAATDDDQPIAYADLERDGHVGHLYCSPEMTRTGVAYELYDALERVACERRMRDLHVEASEPAKRFFLRRGFTTVERRDFILRGVAIHNHKMHKRLGGARLETS